MTITRIVILAKAPVPGLVKTRLIPALGAGRAASLARRMLTHTLQQATAAAVGPVELCVSPAPSDPAWQDWPAVEGIHWTAQSDGDLGDRMANALQSAVAAQEHVLLIGTDCPGLDAVQLRRAAGFLDQSDAVLYPTFDGGYALLGLRQFDPRPFEDMPWSTAVVADRTIERIRELDWTLTVGGMLHDIDGPADLRWLPDNWLSEDSPISVLSATRART